MGSKKKKHPVPVNGEKNGAERYGEIPAELLDGMEQVNTRLANIRGFVNADVGKWLAGEYVKLVKHTDGDFHLVRLTRPCWVLDREEGEVEAQAGEHVGVSARAGVRILETLQEGTRIVVRYNKLVELADDRTYWDTDVWADGAQLEKLPI